MIEIYAAAIAANRPSCRRPGALPALRIADLVRLAAVPAMILAVVALLSAPAAHAPDGGGHAAHGSGVMTVRPNPPTS